MALFGKRYDDSTLKQRCSDLENEVIKLKSRLDSLELTNTDLLNKVLRKIQQPKTIKKLNPEALMPGQTVQFEGDSDGNIQE